VEEDVVAKRSVVSGSRVLDALTDMIRWAQRPEGRARLLGPAASVLSPNDVHLLKAIEDLGSTRVSDLAVWQGVDKSTITPQIRRLEGHGLIERAGDVADRRSVRLGLSAEGRRVAAEMSSCGASTVDAVLSGWSAADRAAFEEYLERFVREVTAVAVKNPPGGLAPEGIRPLRPFGP
jgi:DNA-binding MarR family transcriptional regulator